MFMAIQISEKGPGDSDRVYACLNQLMSLFSGCS